MFRKWSTSFCVYNILIATHLQPEYTTNTHETRGEHTVRRRVRFIVPVSSHYQIYISISTNTYFHIIKCAFPLPILWLFTYMQTPKNCVYTYTCNSLWHNNIHRTPSFALQKPYFCNVKTPFLHAKNHAFATQKPPFWLMPILLL